jgi:hypothetical protein
LEKLIKELGQYEEYIINQAKTKDILEKELFLEQE